MPHRLVIRSRIVQLAAVGLPNAVIATRLGLKVDTVRKWRARFVDEAVAGEIGVAVGATRSPGRELSVSARAIDREAD